MYFLFKKKIIIVRSLSTSLNSNHENSKIVGSNFMIKIRKLSSPLMWVSNNDCYYISSTYQNKNNERLQDTCTNSNYASL